MTVALAIALFVRPSDRSLAADVYVLVLGALALGLLVETTRAAFPAERRSRYGRLRRAGDYAPPPLSELLQTERSVALATGTAFDVHYRLRPLLREVAEHRLATRLGIDLDSAPVAARDALGEQLWELVRADRPRPKHHFTAGVPLAEVRAFLDTLERI